MMSGDWCVDRARWSCSLRCESCAYIAATAGRTEEKLRTWRRHMERLTSIAASQATWGFPFPSCSTFSGNDGQPGAQDSIARRWGRRGSCSSRISAVISIWDPRFRDHTTGQEQDMLHQILIPSRQALYHTPSSSSMDAWVVHKDRSFSNSRCD